MIDKVSKWIEKGGKPRMFTADDISRHHMKLKADISRMGLLAFTDFVAKEYDWTKAKTVEFQNSIGKYAEIFDKRAESYVDEIHRLAKEDLGFDAHNELSWWVEHANPNEQRLFTKSEINKNDRILKVYGCYMIAVMFTDAAQDFGLTRNQAQETKKAMFRWLKAWREGILTHDQLKLITAEETYFDVKGW